MKRLSSVPKLFLATILTLPLLITAMPSEAAFNKNLIMTDNIFSDSGAMDAGQIDAFLNSNPDSCISTNSGFAAKQPTGYTPSNSFTYGNFVSAGNVIYTAARAYGINPRVLIVTLEKEQSLITGRNNFGGYCNNGDQHKYAAAMGYGCPDSGTPHSYSGVSLYKRNSTEYTNTGTTCVNTSDKAGFTQQTIRAAWLLKFGQERSKGNIGWDVQLTNFPNAGNVWDNSDDPQSCYSGRMTQGTFQTCPSGPSTYYDGWYTIDSTATHMDSGATAALYNYTPHFHGNQNFVSLYEQWFGKTISITPLIWEPAAVDQGYGKINVFARGEDRRLWQDWYQNGNWEPNWNYIQGPSSASSAPAAISWGNGHMDVFITFGGSVWHSYYVNDSTGWRPWQSLGRPAGSGVGGTVAVVSQAYGKINLFARGYDGRLWQNWYQNGHWQNSWNTIEGPTSGVSSPTAVSWANGHMDVFETRGSQVWHSYYVNDSTGWRGWQPLGNPSGTYLNKSVAVVSQAYGKLNIFSRGGDGRLWQNWYQNGHWQNSWNTIDGPNSSSSSPSAISWNNGHMDVFETRSGYLWHRYYLADSTGWRPWQQVGRP